MLFMWAGYDMDLTNPSGRMNKTFQIVFSTQGYIDPWGYAINFSRLLASDMQKISLDVKNYYTHFFAF